jgi:hypothetical protein
VLSKNFPYIEFTPKIPKYRQHEDRKAFDDVPPRLWDYLDNKSLTISKGLRFSPIDYVGLYSHEQTQRNVRSGWLKADAELQNVWRGKFGNDKHLIGISASSTMRSKIRDIHTIDLKHWGEVFALKDCVFINLNAGFDSNECQEIEKKYGVQFVTPDINLYDDFDNLLAILSILDFSIVPANNLMDFSAALGVKTLVFSPTNIMRVWVQTNTDNYIFSDKVKFIFPKNFADFYLEEMIGMAVKEIESALRNSQK